MNLLQGKNKSIEFTEYEIQVTEKSIIIFGEDKNTTIPFASNSQFRFWMDLKFDQLLRESFKLSVTDLNVVIFRGSHKYVFSKSLNWGRKYYSLETVVTFEMLAQEKAEFEARKVLYEDIRNLLILRTNN